MVLNWRWYEGHDYREHPLNLDTWRSSIDNQTRPLQALFPCSLRTRRASETTVHLKDGQSFVLAGLLTSEERESLTKIPILGDIPILGALFSHTSTNRSKTELIIVATVNLMIQLSKSRSSCRALGVPATLNDSLRIDLSGTWWARARKTQLTTRRVQLMKWIAITY